MRVFALALLAALGGSARAQERVSQEVLLSADAATVRQVLSDTSLAMGMSREVLEYRIEAAPPCQLVHVTARGLTEPLKYTVRRCPTELGFRETLVSGDAMLEAMEVEWRAEPHGDGSRVRLSVLTRVARVPQVIVNQQVRQSVGNTLRNLSRLVEPKAR